MYALQKVQIRSTIPLNEAEKHYQNITKKKPRKVTESANFYQFRYLPPTKFEKRSFRTKVVNDDIHLIFGKLKDEHARLEGSGLFDYFTKAYDYVSNKASGAFDYFKNALSVTDYSTKTKANLNKYGDFPITAIQLRRVPLSFTLNLALQGISAGEWERLKEKHGIDKLFHLSMVVTLRGAKEIVMNNGVKRKTSKQLAVEKLEVVSVNENIAVGEGMDIQDVPIPANHPTITINGMFSKARERIGDTKFFGYSALDVNCQHFISILLDVEGLYREPEQIFVYQDLSELAKELPQASIAISQGLTQIGALANKYLGIGGNRVTLDNLHGGNQKAGFIRAMMAKDSAGEEAKNFVSKSGQTNAEKFKNLKSFNLQKMSKTTHDLVRKKKDLTRNEAIKRFYDYVLANAPPHEPLSDGKTNYRKTYDLANMFDLWKSTEGVEVREARRAKREEPVVPDDFFPSDMFDLPEAPLPKLGKKPRMVAVQNVPRVMEEEEEKKEPQDVVGVFESPRTQFEREVNKLVNYAVSHLHFNDLITEILNPSAYNEDRHSGASVINEAVLMYYYISYYKLPIVDTFYAPEVRLAKDISTRITSISYRNVDELRQKEEAMFGKNKDKYMPVYNVLPYVTDAPKEYQKRLIQEIRPHLENGEKQVLLFMGIGLKGKSRHANTIIIRAVEKRVYAFDPHGEGRVKDYKAQYKKVDALCTNIADAFGYTYVPSAESCPYLVREKRMGFQAIENLSGNRDGFCAWWAGFIIELCCLKPDTPFNVLYKEASDLLSDEPEQVLRAIVNYQFKLQKIVLEIAEKSGIKDLSKRANMQNVYPLVYDTMYKQLTVLKEKRKELLGYAKTGNQKAGFIRAMMAKDSAGEEAKNFISESGQTNAEKFRNLKSFKLQKMSKTTHDLVRKKKDLTRNEAIKRFYDYVLANAPPHEPLSDGKTNYRKTYDLANMFDQWKGTEGVEVREARRQRREAHEEVFPPPPVPVDVRQQQLIELARQYNTVAKARALGKDEARGIFRRLGGNPRVPGDNKSHRSVNEVARLIAERANEILRNN